MIGDAAEIESFPRRHSECSWFSAIDCNSSSQWTHYNISHTMADDHSAFVGKWVVIKNEKFEEFLAANGRCGCEWWVGGGAVIAGGQKLDRSTIRGRRFRVQGYHVVTTDRRYRLSNLMHIVSVLFHWKSREAWWQLLSSGCHNDNMRCHQ